MAEALNTLKAIDRTGPRHFVLLQIKSSFALFTLVSLSALDNPCGNNNGGCSHMCLIAPGGQTFTCACPDSFKLDRDRVTCLVDCSSNQFACADQEKCIPLSWRCDTEADCADGSDEPMDCRKLYRKRGKFNSS